MNNYLKKTLVSYHYLNMKFFYKYNKFVNYVTSVIKILIFLINKILRL